MFRLRPPTRPFTPAGIRAHSPRPSCDPCKFGPPNPDCSPIGFALDLEGTRKGLALDSLFPPIPAPLDSQPPVTPAFALSRPQTTPAYLFFSQLTPSSLRALCHRSSARAKGATPTQLLATDNQQRTTNQFQSKPTDPTPKPPCRFTNAVFPPAAQHFFDQTNPPHRRPLTPSPIRPFERPTQSAQHRHAKAPTQKFLASRFTFHVSAHPDPPRQPPAPPRV